jgi:hypothetical protein
MLWALIGAGLTLLVMIGVTSYELTVPTVPWSTPVLLFVAAMAGTVLARVTYVKNHVVRQPQDPMRAIAVLAIAKAMLVGGSLLAGGYLVFALFSVGHLDAPLPRQRLITGLISAVASIAVVVAGWATERACRAPDDDENPDT